MRPAGDGDRMAELASMDGSEEAVEAELVTERAGRPAVKPAVMRDDALPGRLAWCRSGLASGVWRVALGVFRERPEGLVDWVWDRRLPCVG